MKFNRSRYGTLSVSHKSLKVSIATDMAWLTKSHPYWFSRQYSDGSRTFQSMWINVWWR